MEDAHATILSLDEESGDNNSFFAVYDGHGGSFYRSILQGRCVLPSPP